MELFKLFGTIAINNQDALKDIKQTTTEAKKTDAALDMLGKTAGKVGTAMGKFGTTITKMTTTAIIGTTKALVGLTGAIVAVGTNAVKYNADMETYATSFEVMTGSAEEATKLMKELKELGAKTPFEFADLAKATQLLMNYGFTAEEATNRMMMLGDIAQGDSEKMERIAMAYGQMSSAGKVSLEDVKQMIEAGFNPLQEISESTGESMESLYNRISKGTLTVDELTESMKRSTSAGGKYFQSMDKQSKTLLGRISTLKDNIQQLTGELFSGISDMVADEALPLVIAWVDQLATIFEEEGLDAFIAALGNILGAGLKHISSAIPQFAKMGFNLLNGLISGIKNNSKEIANAIVTFVVAFQQGFSEFFVNFTETGLQIASSLLEGILENLPEMVETGIELLENLVEGITDALPQITGTAVQIIDKLVSQLTSQDGISRMINAGVKLFTALVEDMETIITTISNALPEITDKIIEAFGSAEVQESMKDAGISIIYSLLSGLNAVWGMVVQWVDAKADWIASKFGGISFEFGGAGGVSSGISGLSGVFTKVTSTGSTKNRVSGTLSNSRSSSTSGKGKVGGYAEGGVIPKGQIAFLEGYGAEAVIPLDRNEKWISAVARDMNNALGGNTSAIENKLDVLIGIMQQSLNTRIYLDTGILVGEMTSDLDASLGEVDNMRKRGG